MKPKKKFAIYRHNTRYGRKGFWERCGQYNTPEATKQALKDFTNRPKRERIFVYIVLPNLGPEKCVLLNHHEQLLKSAR